MESSKNLNQASPKSSPLAYIALFRLGLLLVPEAIIITALHHNHIICPLICLLFLALWLSVDVWPFRARSNRADQATVKDSIFAGFQKMGKAQWWGCLIAKGLLVIATFHSKLTI